MAFKMKPSSMHKGTSSHKKALSSFNAAEETSSMKKMGVFKVNPDGTRTRIPASEIEQSEQFQEGNVGINLVGRFVNQDEFGGHQDIILTGRDILRTPDAALEADKAGGYTSTTAPFIVPKQTDYMSQNYQVSKDTDLSKLSLKDLAKMKKENQFMYTDAGNRRKLLDSEGVDEADLNVFLEDAGVPGITSIGSLTDGAKYDKAVQAFFNAGKPTRAQTRAKRETGKS